VDLSVIVPVRNDPRGLRECLSAVRSSHLPAESFEIIVADDASEVAEVREVAEELGDALVQIPHGPKGPAHARNRGAQRARGEILVFVDSDVRIHPGTLAGFRDALGSFPDVAAVFGSYDTSPEAPGLVSQFRNLQHHYVHTTNAGEAETFWAGCGAIRKSVFLQVGGFDDLRYRRPKIEDIELGHRIRDAGWKILLQPELLATHLKRWTLMGGILSDVRDRGAPWTELMIQDWGKRKRSRAVLNLEGKERLAAFLVLVGWTAAAGALIAWDARWLLLMLGAFGLALILNMNMIRWFARERGWFFAAAAIPLRLLYYTLHPFSVAYGLWLAARRRSSGSERAPFGRQ
jgi:glycosyltransferase involved in cell wall biosynthesis